MESNPEFELHQHMGPAPSAETLHVTRSLAEKTSDAQLFPPNVSGEDPDRPASDQSATGPEYASGLRLVIIVTTICFSTLLTALDLGIVATAIPAITDEFHQLEQVGWYGSAIFLLAGTTSPMWGKVYRYMNAKIVYLAAFAIFLIGSLVAALAPNSIALVVARAIQGWGCAGTLSGSVLMINYVVEPKARPLYIGLWMGVFMISTILGPLIGGAFTTNVTWRWCFWVNLPVGGPVVVLILLFFYVPRHVQTTAATWKEIVLQLDLPGFVFLLTSLICFTLALQWGGQTKPWSDGSVIAVLVMWITLTLSFILIEWWQGSYAMVPLNLMRTRMTWSNSLYGLINNLTNFQSIFYLPIYFQSIHGQSAIISGVNNLPYVAFFAAGTTLCGYLISKTGFIQPFYLASALLSTAGAALLYTLDVDSSLARYVGPQLLLGFGVGLGNQIPMTAVQSFSKPEDVESATGIMLMFNALSGAYFVTAAQSLFANRLLQELSSIAPNLDLAKVLATGATQIRQIFSGTDLDAVLKAYMVGIKDVFAFSMAGAGLTVLLALLIPSTRLNR
ncbi:putative MFS transporter [Seiridium cardinale]|uniref:MFS transporter n=1 Tax=Seiridium cardinale TaxID=138064 RepID=A0ABR2XTU0_9PEZI